jgi:hypothetical protein
MFMPKFAKVLSGVDAPTNSTQSPAAKLPPAPLMAAVVPAALHVAVQIVVADPVGPPASFFTVNAGVPVAATVAPTIEPVQLEGTVYATEIGTTIINCELDVCDPM